MAFTAKDVAVLREKTGCGMMDCKNALTESNGDMDKAIELLREKGLAAAAKKSGRIAAEGLVYTASDSAKKVGVIVEVNSETDFVAKNADFQNFVAGIANAVVNNKPADVDALFDCKYDDKDTVAEVLREKILKIGENMKIRRFVRIDGDTVSYIHGGGRIGVLVDFDTDVASNEKFEEFGKDVAMQIAALNPLYLSNSDVPEEVIASEKDILMVQIQNDPKNASKPENIIEKMVEGRIRKYYEENCLLNQAYVKDGAISVAKYVENTAKEMGGKITVKSFVRFEKGEGLEKREDNFADEVANMVK